MAKTIPAGGVFTIDDSRDAGPRSISEYSVGAASGPLGSVIHGLRIELQFRGDSTVTLTMGAADALQLAEEIRAAVHRREDVRR